ncbi:MAG TPA: glycoside hydrolase family 18 protein [Verrucomicrobiae bacterium]|jgi:chitinase
MPAWFKYAFISSLLWCLACSARADLWVAGYYPGYEADAMAPSNIDFTAITHVIHFSLVPNTDGSINSSDNSLTSSACKQLVAVTHAAGRKALICVGGASTEPDFQSATTPANLGAFVTNIVHFMTNYGYDGVDLDWEPFNSSDTAQYSNLVNALHTALKGAGAHKLLTVAAPAYPEYGDSPAAEFTMLASLQNQFDQINIMTYDLSGPYEGWVTWFNSPIYDGGFTFPSAPSELVPSINGAVSNFVNNGVQPAKLGVGMPFYGYTWTGGPGVTQPRQGWPDNNPPTVTTPSYAQVVNNYFQSNRYHWDSIAQSACLSITNTPATGDMFISYDDARACGSKVSYARNLHLGGVMIWELSLDYFPSQAAGQRTPLTAALKQALATPNIASIQNSRTNVNISFTSAPLGLYRVEWASNLITSSWNTLTNNVAGTGTNVPVADPTPAIAPSRFYRVQTPP